MMDKEPNRTLGSTSAKRLPSRRHFPGMTLIGEIDGPRNIAEENFACRLALGDTAAGAMRIAFPRRSRWKPAALHVKACKLAGTNRVQIRVRQLLADPARANGVEVATVLSAYLLRLKADPRELVEYRISACRHCHGANGRHQFTNGELELARERHDAKQRAAVASGGHGIGEFDARGGGGYSRLLRPREDCAECGGEGVGRVVVKDTANLSPGALALFQGLKATRDGVEVKLADRDAALLQLARHVGFLEPESSRDENLAMDYAELDAIYAAALQQARAGHAAIQGRRPQAGQKSTEEG